MKRTITITVLAATMLLAAATAALATHVDDTSHDEAGYGTQECRPGADNDLIGSWELMNVEDFIAEYLAVTGRNLDPERADATWDFCDKNRDGLLCVMKQLFPDGAPGTGSWNLLDNRPFGG